MYTSKTSNKSYIGLTKFTVDKRLNEHLQSVKTFSNTHFHNAIRKYSINDFEIKILKDGITDYKILKLCEIFYIAKYNTFSKGYNMTKGGDGGNTRLKMTPKKFKSYCKNISIANKGRKFSEEHKTKISIAKTLNPSKQVGNKNGRARKINIYNNLNELMYISNGNFKQICNINNLPYGPLTNSYINNVKLKWVRISKYSSFSGWYAVYDIPLS